MLNQEQLQRLLKSWGKSMLSDKSALPQSTAHLATHYFKLLWKSSVQKHTFYLSTVWNSTKLWFSFEHIHFQMHQPKKCTWLCTEEKAAEGGFVRDRYTHVFPKDIWSRSMWWSWHFLPNAHGAPPVSEDSPVLKSGGISKRYKSACSLT